jgi:hypothetical protein
MPKRLSSLEWDSDAPRLGGAELDPQCRLLWREDQGQRLEQRCTADKHTPHQVRIANHSLQGLRRLLFLKLAFRISGILRWLTRFGSPRLRGKGSNVKLTGRGSKDLNK